MLASSDTFTITVTGRGGHAAQPHNTIDPVLAASQIVVALQSIASRNADPLKPVVVSVTGLRTSSYTSNVIPQEVELVGTARALEPAMQDLIEARMRTIIESVAAAFDAEARFVYERGYPVTANAAAQADFAARVAAEVAGARNVDAAAPPVMGAEDFSYMLNARPGAFIFAGNGDTAQLHHPKYDFNDELIPLGCSYWARLVETAMPAG